MCYRCEACGLTTPPGFARKTHIVVRQKPIRKFKQILGFDVQGNMRPRLEVGTTYRAEIEREMSVCDECHGRLTSGGLTLPQLLELLEKKRRQIERKAEIITLPIRRTRLAPPIPCGDAS